MIFQLLTPTITGANAILYQTDNYAEMQVVREKYESMRWDVWIRTRTHADLPDGKTIDQSLF